MKYETSEDQKAINGVIFTLIQKSLLSNKSPQRRSITLVSENRLSMAMLAGGSDKQSAIVSADLFEQLTESSSRPGVFDRREMPGIGLDIKMVDLPANGLSGDSWLKFESAFPGAGGYYAFSPIAVNKTRDKAAVLIAYYCPAFCGGFGGLATFSKTNSHWQADGLEKYWSN